MGWFRINENGDALVQSGDIFLDKIHHAKTNNCAEQRFRSVLEASYYVNNEDNVCFFLYFFRDIDYFKFNYCYNIF